MTGSLGASAGAAAPADDTASTSFTQAVAALAHFSAIATTAIVVFHLADSGPYHGDLALYHRWSTKLLWGQIPHLDFAYEYPSFALLPMLLPYGLAVDATLSFHEYVTFFLLSSAAASALLGLRLARFVESRGGSFAATFVAYTVLLCPLAPHAASRFDLFPAACAVLGVLAAVDGRPARAGVWLSAGTAIKLFPGLLVPFVAAWYVARGDRAALSRFAAATATTSALAVALAALLAGAELLSFLEYHRLRGLQIESVPAAALGTWSALGLAAPLEVVHEFGAAHLDSPLADRLAQASPFVTVGLLGLLWGGFGRRAAGDGGDPLPLLVAAAASLTTFLATNKVLSPQYVIWLVPWLALLPRSALTWVPRVLLVVLTVVVHPLTYPSLIRLEAGALAWLDLRNVVLVWVAAELAWSAVRAREVAAS